MELHRYIIGGQLVMISHDAAARWNEGRISRRDLLRSSVWVNKDDGTGDWLQLLRAVNPRKQPKLAAMLDGQEAVLDSRQQIPERIFG